MNKGNSRFLVVIAILAALLVAAAALSLCLGEKSYSPADVTRIMFQWAAGRGRSAGTDFVIVTQLRLPRLISGIIVGMSLAAAGAALQGLLRNPLAEPFVLGISGGASIGVCAGILLQAVAHFGFYAIPFSRVRRGASINVAHILSVAVRRRFFPSTT